MLNHLGMEVLPLRDVVLVRVKHVLHLRLSLTNPVAYWLVDEGLLSGFVSLLSTTICFYLRLYCTYPLLFSRLLCVHPHVLEVPLLLSLVGCMSPPLLLGHLLKAIIDLLFSI